MAYLKYNERIGLYDIIWSPGDAKASELVKLFPGLRSILSSQFSDLDQGSRAISMINAAIEILEAKKPHRNHQEVLAKALRRPVNRTVELACLAVKYCNECQRRLQELVEGLEDIEENLLVEE